MQITGTPQNDTITAHSGDVVTALGGDDIITLDTQGLLYGEGFFTVDGGAGNDTIVAADSTDIWPFYTVQTKSVENLQFSTTLADDYIDVTLSVSMAGATGKTFRPAVPTHVTGSIGQDSLTISVTGGSGTGTTVVMPNMTFTNWTVAPTAISSQGDYLGLAAGDGAGYRLQANAALAKAGIEQDLYGNSGNDVLVGSSAGDFLWGRGGADTIYGGGGNDVIALNQRYALTDGDVFDGGKGIDEFAVFGAVQFAGTFRSIEVIDFHIGMTITASGLHNSRTVPAELHFTAAQAAHLPKALRLTGFGILYLTGEHIFSAAHYQFDAGARVTLNITGSGGDDHIVGSSANDTFHAGTGHDVFDGLAGSNTVAFDDASIVAGVNINLAKTGAQADGAGSSIKLSHVDNVIGSAFDDVLHGNGNTNSLYGGAGNDWLFGGDEHDQLTGGSGSDTFAFATPTLTGGISTIADFSEADHDHIAISRSAFGLAETVAGGFGDGAFYAASNVTGAHAATDRVVYDTATGNLYVTPHGDASPAWYIATLTGAPTLSASDFLIIG